MHANVPVRFGEGRLEKGCSTLSSTSLAAYSIARDFGLRAHVEWTGAGKFGSRYAWRWAGEGAIADPSWACCWRLVHLGPGTKPSRGYPDRLLCAYYQESTP
jgi:hypothetical protein